MSSSSTLPRDLGTSFGETQGAVGVDLAPLGAWVGTLADGRRTGGGQQEGAFGKWLAAWDGRVDTLHRVAR